MNASKGGLYYYTISKRCCKFQADGCKMGISGKLSHSILDSSLRHCYSETGARKFCIHRFQQNVNWTCRLATCRGWRVIEWWRWSGSRAWILSGFYASVMKVNAFQILSFRLIKYFQSLMALSTDISGCTGQNNIHIDTTSSSSL
jgi:hypothetical protein